MTATDSLLWLPDNRVVYQPTEKFETDGLNIYLDMSLCFPSDCVFCDDVRAGDDDDFSPNERGVTLSVEQYLEHFEPSRAIDSEVERECPTCGGLGHLIGSVPMRSVDTGETGDFPVFKNGSFERHPCTEHSCTDGTQKRRIVSATLKTGREFREPLGKRLGKSYRITGKESAADGSTVYQFDDSGQMAWVGTGECELLTNFVEQRQLELFNGL